MVENKTKSKSNLMTIYDYIDQVFDKLLFGKAKLEQEDANFFDLDTYQKQIEKKNEEIKYLDKISKQSLSIGVRSQLIYLELSTPEVLQHQHDQKERNDYIRNKKDYYTKKYEIENKSYIDQIISNLSQKLNQQKKDWLASNLDNSEKTVNELIRFLKYQKVFEFDISLALKKPKKRGLLIKTQQIKKNQRDKMILENQGRIKINQSHQQSEREQKLNKLYIKSCITVKEALSDYKKLDQLIDNDGYKDQVFEAKIYCLFDPSQKNTYRFQDKIVKAYNNDEYFQEVTKNYIQDLEMINNQKELQEYFIRMIEKDQTMKKFWSGDDIRNYSDMKYGEIGTKSEQFNNQNLELMQKRQNNQNKILYALNNQDQFEHFISGLKGFMHWLRKKCYQFTINQYFDTFIIVCVIANTFTLCLDGFAQSKEDKVQIERVQESFAIIFLIEMVLKIISLGISGYVKDKFNIFDGLLVSVSIVEMASQSGSKGLNAFRLLKIVRVLRMTRLIRSLKYMRIIITVLSSTISSAIYILLLLLLIIYVYSILGMFIYKKQLNKTNGKDMPYRQNFEDFQNAFLTIFQMLTVENWNNILTACMVSNVSTTVTLIYLLSCQIILSYILHKLFQAILLQGFEDPDILEEKEDLNDEIECYNQQTNMIYLNGKNKSEKEEAYVQKSEIKDINDSKQKFVYFEENTCEQSLFIFSKQNKFRKCCNFITKQWYFELFIMIVIVFSSIQLSVDSYNDNENLKNNSETNLALINIFYTMNFIYSGIFLVEAIMKIVSEGLIWDQTSYLRNSWNILDFTVVIVSLIEVSIEIDEKVNDTKKMNNANLKSLKILRLFRVLRPLRFISKNKGMKVVVTAILESFGGIANVFIVIFLSMVMLGIIGMNLMMNKLGYCSSDDLESIYGVNRPKCLKMGGSWEIYPYNMDNILSALLTIFVFATTEGWNDMVYSYLDGNDPEIGPSYESRMWMLYYIYPVIYLCAFFLVDLFVGVVFFNYVIAENKIKQKSINQDLLKWIQIQKIILKEKPNYDVYRPITNKIQVFFKKMITYGNIFDNIIMLVIIANVITMCLLYDDCSDEHKKKLDLANMAFSIVFIVEAVIKIIALGKNYFFSKANVFDFFLVILSIIDLFLDILMDGHSSNNSALSVVPPIARIFRVTRVTRVFKLIKQFKSLVKLIQTTVVLLPAMLNILALIFLMFFIFAIIAVFLFKDIKSGESINQQYSNFSNFGCSYLMMFRMATGEDWHAVMYDTMKHNKLNVIYFLLFVITFQYIMVNLFVLVILREFDEHYNNFDNPFVYYNDYFHVFKIYWNKYAQQSQGIKVSQKDAAQIYLEMEKPLGLGFKKQKIVKSIIQEEKDEEGFTVFKQRDKLETNEEYQKRLNNYSILCYKILLSFEIYVDEFEYVYFNEFLFKIYKNTFQSRFFSNLSVSDQRILEISEQKTNIKLARKNNKIFVSQMAKEIYKCSQDNQIEQNKLARQSSFQNTKIMKSMKSISGIESIQNQESFGTSQSKFKKRLVNSSKEKKLVAKQLNMLKVLYNQKLYFNAWQNFMNNNKYLEKSEINSSQQEIESNQLSQQEEIQLSFNYSAKKDQNVQEFMIQ